MSEDFSILDELDRRNRRAQLISPRKPRIARAPRPVTSPVAAHRLPGAPTRPPGWQDPAVQSKAAQSRVGNRNAANTTEDNDDMCEAVLEILRRIAERL